MPHFLPLLFGPSFSSPALHSHRHASLNDTESSLCISIRSVYSLYLYIFAPWFCSFRLWRFINHLLTYLLTYLLISLAKWPRLRGIFKIQTIEAVRYQKRGFLLWENDRRHNNTFDYWVDFNVLHTTTRPVLNSSWLLTGRDYGPAWRESSLQPSNKTTRSRSMFWHMSKFHIAMLRRDCNADSGESGCCVLPTSYRYEQAGPMTGVIAFSLSMNFQDGGCDHIHKRQFVITCDFINVVLLGLIVESNDALDRAPSAAS